MRRALHPLLCFSLTIAAVSACSGGGYTNGSNPTDPATGSFTGTSTGGAGGGSGGGADAGCAGLPPLMKVTDHCGSIATTVTTVTMATCNVDFAWNGGSAFCNGALTGGTTDAFSGGCGTLNNCSSQRIPGVISCASSPTTTCNIDICNADAGNCP
jgi:hypothetical protein